MGGDPPGGRRGGANAQSFAGEMDTVHKAAPQRRTPTVLTMFLFCFGWCVRFSGSVLGLFFPFSLVDLKQLVSFL